MLLFFFFFFPLFEFQVYIPILYIISLNKVEKDLSIMSTIDIEIDTLLIFKYLIDHC